VALQQTTRELWAQQGPFEQYTIHGVPQQNIPEVYIKGAVWNAQADPPRYVAQSSAPEESGTGTWFPVDFNCHGSAGTPIGTHAGREALGLQDARTAIRT
jgi:hypothetical protein